MAFLLPEKNFEYGSEKLKYEVWPWEFNNHNLNLKIIKQHDSLVTMLIMLLTVAVVTSMNFNTSLPFHYSH